MHLKNVECCARWLRGVATLGWALFALNLVESSVCFAASLSGGTYSIDIKVVDSAGPVWVEDQYLGVANNGLPTIKINEKIKQQGDDRIYWADVELMVKVCTHRDKWDYDWDYGWGHDDWDQDWDWDYGDSGYGDDSFGWYSFGDGHDSWGNEPNGGEPPEPWEEDVEIGIDKFVRNRTDSHWSEFRIVLGSGVGDDFVPADSSDDLYFLAVPMAKETTSFYTNPPERDFPESEFLQWTTDDPNSPGQGFRDRAGFWFGVNVPHELLEANPHKHGCWSARFTLRQHTGVPEPASLVLLLTSSLIGFLYRGSKLR